MIKLRYRCGCTIEFSKRHYVFIERSGEIGPVYECEVPGDAVDRQFATIPGVSIVPVPTAPAFVLVGSYDRGVTVNNEPYLFHRTRPEYPYGVCYMSAEKAEWLFEWAGASFWPAGESRTLPEVPASKSQNIHDGGTTTLCKWRLSEDQDEVMARIEQEKKNMGGSERTSLDVMQDIFISDAAKQHPSIKAKMEEIEKSVKHKADNYDEPETELEPRKKRVEKVRSILGEGLDLEIAVSESLSALQSLVVPDEIGETQDVVEATVKIDINSHTYYQATALLESQKFTIEEYDYMMDAERKGKNRVSVLKIIKNHRSASINIAPIHVGRKFPWQK